MLRNTAGIEYIKKLIVNRMNKEVNKMNRTMREGGFVKKSAALKRAADLRKEGHKARVEVDGYVVVWS